jgi:hypothetical protein
MRHEFINLDLINACHCRRLRRSEKVRIAPASRALNTRLQPLSAPPIRGFALVIMVLLDKLFDSEQFRYCPKDRSAIPR